MNVDGVTERVITSGTSDVRRGQRPSWLDERLYPFESHYVELSENRVHYIDEGGGPTLLFLHAGPAWSFIYRNFITSLRGQFRCIALDYPGFGLSTASENYGYTLLEHADIVEQFIHALDLRDLTLVVHDAGGPIGLGAVGRHPERVRALVITDTFGWPLTEYPSVARVLRFVSGPVFAFLNRHFNLLPWIVARFAPQRRKLSPVERAAYTGAFPTPASRQRILTLFHDLVAQEDYLRTVERSLKEQLWERPALLMYGEDDPARRVGWQARFEEVFANHHSVVIEGEGHFPHEGAPDEMIAAMRDWWKAVVEERA